MERAVEAETMTWQVAGMDCASCANKIRGAVERLPGVSDVRISVVSERLTLKLGGGGAEPARVERTVEGLGYKLSRGTGAAEGRQPRRAFRMPGDAAPAEEAGDGGAPETRSALQEKAWHQSRKGRLVVLTAALLAAAWTGRLILPEEAAGWLFVAACIVGVAPVARRAWAALRAGVPFTIEGLMTIAALGALSPSARPRRPPSSSSSSPSASFSKASRPTGRAPRSGRSRISSHARRCSSSREAGYARSTRRGSGSATPCSSVRATGCHRTAASSRACRAWTRAR